MQRISDLISPLLAALGPDRCTVLYRDAKTVPSLPCKVDAVSWMQAIPHDRARWRQAFRGCWPLWRERLESLSKSFHMPRGAMERLSLNILVNSQLALGSLRFLKRCRPAAIVTDYDRAGLSSCIVLAARSLGIPTFTLQHGVLDDDADGYVPVIADRMFCWGEVHRRSMIEAGQDAAKLAIGGCPRLTRELTADSQEARRRLNIDPSHRVVMLGTSPVPPPQRRLLAEWFCEALEKIDGASGVVRLHPSESLEFYADIAKEHPRVQFMDNARFSLDESLSATDVVVVQSSGLGGDALVKRRLTVVVETPDAPLGHGNNLIEHAGCLRATSSEELVTSLRCVLFDEEARLRHFTAAERYVADFCAYFGQDSAQRIAESVRHTISASTGGQP